MTTPFSLRCAESFLNSIFPLLFFKLKYFFMMKRGEYMEGLSLENMPSDAVT